MRLLLVCYGKREGLQVKKHFAFSAVLTGLLLLCGCSRDSTDHLKAVTPFDPAQYMGRWYEIARYPHRFEKDLYDVTADYAPAQNGRVNIRNRGITASGTVREIEGTAYLPDTNTGLLRVSFFRPFYGDYKIIFLEKDYSGAIVTSGTMNFLWILARKKTLTPEKKRKYLETIRDSGFDPARLEWVRRTE